MSNAKSEAIRKVYGSLFDDVLALLFRHDPIDINFDVNADEYDPETRTILPRLNECRSADDVQQVVIAEFRRWFGHDIHQDRANYPQIASEIWELWSIRTPGS